MSQLSCFTANLHAYAAREWDVDAWLARSVRLAARVDASGRADAFSHHDPPLDTLPDGSRLEFRGADSWPDARSEIEDELVRHGRVLLLVDGTRLPWSVAREGSTAVPHWVLLDDPAPGRWHLTDEFEALLPTGEQRPGAGWLAVEDVPSAHGGPKEVPDRAWTRADLAFGALRTVPRRAAAWLVRRPPGEPGVPEPGLPGTGWLLGADRVCRHLAAQLATSDPSPADVDDLWAAAGHHAFALAWESAHPGAAGDAAGPDPRCPRAEAWTMLPRVVRFVTESTARGRARPGLVARALTRLADLEEASLR